MKLIQMANSTATAVASGEKVPLGVIDRREVCGDIDVFTTTDTTISLNRAGYYLVNVTATFVAGVAGTASIQLYEGDTPNATAIASATATANDSYNLSFSKVIRVFPNCCANTTNLPKVLSVYNVGVAGSMARFNISVVKVN